MLSSPTRSRFYQSLRVTVGSCTERVKLLVPREKSPAC